MKTVQYDSSLTNRNIMDKIGSKTQNLSPRETKWLQTDFHVCKLNLGSGWQIMPSMLSEIHKTLTDSRYKIEKKFIS